jgi:hypothetical protein
VKVLTGNASSIPLQLLYKTHDVAVAALGYVHVFPLQPIRVMLQVAKFIFDGALSVAFVF